MYKLTSLHCAVARAHLGQQRLVVGVGARAAEAADGQRLAAELLDDGGDALERQRSVDIRERTSSRLQSAKADVQATLKWR